ncbi:helix-turn-helix domain-containing protein [Candidatus Kuenenia stuttgartiensis]|nr:helix-turn-helix transcriptional regulator [Candidatus Kuenenia stuttgartiensis]
MRKKIRARLLMKDITLAEIARGLGVSRTWVSLVVNGHKKSPRIQRAIADALGVSYESLWNGHCNN